MVTPATRGTMGRRVRWAGGAGLVCVAAGVCGGQHLFGTPQWTDWMRARVVVVGDVDGVDGVDLVVANTEDSTITVFFNDGAGEVMAPVTYGVVYEVDCVALGDLDGDGSLDVVTAHAADDRVGVMLNDGGGSFGPIAHYGDTNGACRLTLAPMDSDASLDIVAASNSAGYVWTLTNNGDGTFQARTGEYLGRTQVGTASGDLDGDAWPDVALCLSGDDRVRVLLNDQAGGFVTPHGSVDVSQEPVAVTMAELDGVNRPDLAVACETGACVDILVNDGSGGFAVHQSVPVGGSPVWIVAGDVDQDGDVDLVTASSDTSTLSVLLSNLSEKGAGDPLEYTLVADLATRAYVDSVALADIDGDGDVDLIDASDGARAVGALLNYTEWPDGELRFGPYAPTPTVASPVALALGDVGEDAGQRDTDVVVVPDAMDGTNQYFMHVHTNDGFGGLTTASTAEIFVPVVDVVLADLDGDGDRDVAALEDTDQDDMTLIIAPNDGSGGFAVPGPGGHAPAVTDGVELLAEDLDLDGDTDLVAARWSQIAVLLNDGTGAFTRTMHATSSSTADIALGDVDDDGDVDVLYAADSSGYLPGNGDGTFGSAIAFDTNGGAAGGTIGGTLIAVSEFAGVVWPHVVAGQDRMMYRLRKASGGGPGDFEIYDAYPTGEWMVDLDIVSLDNFLIGDVVISHLEGGAWVYRFKPLFNEYDGPFVYTAGPWVRDLAVADMDRDTRPDLVSVGTIVSTLFHAPSPFPCIGDLTGDQRTDVFDFAELTANFGMGPDAVRTDGDLNGDGWVNVFDFSDLAADFGCTNDPGARR